MTAGRTLEIWTRVYANGYDLSGYARAVGDLGCEVDAGLDAAFADAVKSVTPGGQAKLSFGPLNVFFDNTALGAHALLSAGNEYLTLLVAKGIQGPPAAGDPVFAGQFAQLDYRTAQGDSSLAATARFDSAHAVAAHLSYQNPWGVLLHANAAETAVNTATGIDDNGAATTKGGYLCYQIFSVAGTGNVTIKVQHASTNLDGSFSDLSGATSGAIAHTSVPTAGIVGLGTTVSVLQYLRWQIVLSGITSVTFALSFHRAR